MIDTRRKKNPLIPNRIRKRSGTGTMMNAKVLILLTEILFSDPALVSGQEVRTEDRSERAEKRAEEW